MRLISCLMVTIISLSIFACGGENVGEGSVVVFVPEKIPSQYEGLSMGELAAKSSDISHQNIIGITSEAEYTGTTSEGAFTSEEIKDITANIMKHKGTLLHDIGFIETVYPSSKEGVFTLWFCSLREGDQEIKISSELRKDNDCDDPLFLLYDLDRGPELQTGDIIEIAGVIVGTQRKTAPTISWNIIWTTQGYYPTINVIKAAMSNQGD